MAVVDGLFRADHPNQSSFFVVFSSCRGFSGLQTRMKVDKMYLKTLFVNVQVYFQGNIAFPVVYYFLSHHLPQSQMQLNYAGPVLETFQVKFD